MAIEPYRPEGRYITARDVAERLMPDLNMNEVLLWSPDLFAYTSYIMTMTSAYQLVVSPPSKGKWQPRRAELIGLLYENAEENFADWLATVKAEWGFEENFDFKGVSDSFKEAVEELGNKDKIFRDDLVKDIGYEWRNNLNKISKADFDLIDDNAIGFEEKRGLSQEESEKRKGERQKELLRIVLTNTPPLLLSCWAFFYKQVTRPDFHDNYTLRISDLLCTQDYIQSQQSYCKKLWKVSQALLTMHAIADIASVQFGITADTTERACVEVCGRIVIRKAEGTSQNARQRSLSTFNTERCRVLPKQHNPNIGITLRSNFKQSGISPVGRRCCLKKNQK